ncbi:MAG: hypothetical protein NTY65_17010 [Planctomycetota bacterium]|nr:hypothetical protein [Planctomycetota bacterium]
MNAVLAELFLDLSAFSDEEAEQVVFEKYAELYLDCETRTGWVGIRKTHDGQDVVFFEDRFVHAFYTSKEKTSRQYAKDRFERSRGERIAWIGPLVAGEIDGSECWLIPPKDGGRHLDDRPPNRFYLLRQEGYVVWLEPRKNGGWKFSSAYVAGHNLERYCTEGRLFWKKSTP